LFIRKAFIDDEWVEKTQFFDVLGITSWVPEIGEEEF
jgi:hypothetical protein